MPAILPTWASAPTAVTSIDAAAVGDRGVHERHVRLVAGTEIRVGERLVVSFDAGVLSPGQRGLVDVQRAGLDDPAVGGHVVAGG